MIQLDQLSKAALVMNEAQRQMSDLLGVKVNLFFELDGDMKINSSYIIRTVSHISGVSIEEMLGKSRAQEVCYARFVCFYHMHKYLAMSKASIGRIFNKDHSTVINGLDVLQNEQSNTILQDLLKQTEEMIKEEAKNEN